MNGFAYVAFYDPTNPTAGWNAILGPITASGTTLSFTTAASIALTMSANTTYTYAIVETGTPLPTPTPSPSPTPTPSGSPTPVPGNGTPLPNVAGPSGAWGPFAVANALQFPVQSGFNGTGQTVAVVITSNIYQSDLANYLSYFQVPTTNRTVSVRAVDGASGITSGQGEATLDVETVAGLAPGANIIIYQIPALTGQDATDAYNAIISDNLASVVNSSFGGCEYAGVSGGTEDTVLQTGANSGIAFMASSGDQGNECFTGGTPTYQVGVGYPSSDPNVTGVGGTETLQNTFPITSSTVWNDTSCASGQCAGGGGVSTSFPLPSFQQNLSGESSTQFRNVPDISMPAEGTAEYENGAWSITNGTSWSAPQYAALMAEVYDYCNAPFKNPITIPYFVFGQNPADFIDVVSGNDQFAGSSPFYTAGAGYDNASGIGVPFGMPFANTICPNRVPASRTRRAPSHAMVATAMHAPAQAYAVNVSPRLAGLQDLGERMSSAQTRVQIVLRPTSSLAADEQALISVLQSSGFTIAQRFANHLVVDAQAPSATVEQFFSTRIHSIAQGQYGTRYAPVGQSVIPAPIAQYVAGINLDDVVTAHTPPI